MHRTTVISVALVFLLCLAVALGAWWRFSAPSSSSNPPSPKPLLKHLGIIMDGNRRWAKKRGLKPWEGHRKGVEPLRTAVQFCLDNHIPYLTVYAFSLENLKRPPEELDYLFSTIARELASSEFEQLIHHGVRVRFVGDATQFPEQLKPIMRSIEERTASCSRLTLTILFCYGGRQEIIDAVKRICAKVQEGELAPEDITDSVLYRFLWNGSVPDPDLIIRTAGACRLSNFLPYQSTYSELYTLDRHWPEVTTKELQQACQSYTACSRNFGS